MKQQLENWSFIEVWEMLKIYNGPYACAYLQVIRQKRNQIKKLLILVITKLNQHLNLTSQLILLMMVYMVVKKI